MRRTQNIRKYFPHQFFAWPIDILLHWKAIFCSPSSSNRINNCEINKTLFVMTCCMLYALLRRFNQFSISIKSLPQTKGHKYLHQFDFSKWIKIIIMIFGWFVAFFFFLQFYVVWSTFDFAIATNHGFFLFSC